MFLYRAIGLDATDSRRPTVDYSHVLGFGSQTERIDPHSHVQRSHQQPSLVEIAKTIREGATQSTPAEPKSKE